MKVILVAVIYLSNGSNLVKVSLSFLCACIVVVMLTPLPIVRERLWWWWWDGGVGVLGVGGMQQPVM